MWSFEFVCSSCTTYFARRSWTHGSIQQAAHVFAKDRDVLMKIHEMGILSAKNHAVTVQSLSNDLEKGWNMAEDALELAVKTGYRDGEGDALLNMGRVKHSSGLYTEAMEYFLKDKVCVGIVGKIC